jgi:hypothetical protein
MQRALAALHSEFRLHEPAPSAAEVTFSISKSQ